MCLKCGSGVHRAGTDLYSNGLGVCLFPVRGNYWVSDLVRNEFSQGSDRHCTCHSLEAFVLLSLLDVAEVPNLTWSQQMLPAELASAQEGLRKCCVGAVWHPDLRLAV